MSNHDMTRSMLRRYDSRTSREVKEIFEVCQKLMEKEGKNE